MSTFSVPRFGSLLQVIGSFFISALSLWTIAKCLSNLDFLSNCKEHLEQYKSLKLMKIFFWNLFWRIQDFLPLFDLLIYIDLSLKLPFEPEASSRFVCFEITPTKFCSVLNFIKLSKSYYRTSYVYVSWTKKICKVYNAGIKLYHCIKPVLQNE